MTVVGCVVLLVYAIVKHTAEKSFFLIFLSIADLFFTFGNLLEISAPSLETAFYGIRVQYVGAPFIVPLTYLFIRDVYGEKRFSPRKLGLFFVIPLLCLLALQAFPLLRLHYADISYLTNGYIANCQHTRGPLYLLGTAFNYLCIFLMLRQILRRLRGGSKLQRQQSLVLLAGVVAPLIANVIYIFLGGEKMYDLTPLMFVVSVAAFMYAVLIQNLLNVIPLARVQVIEALEDAFVVCDTEFNFLDANRAARQLFPQLSRLAPGESMQRVEHFKSEGEVCIPSGDEIRCYKATPNYIQQGEKNSGVCIVFRDITEENRLLKNLHLQATVDPLMDIYNRGTFFELAGTTLDSPEAKSCAFALLMIDVDHFKQVNDTYGHLCGDIALKNVATIVKNHCRKNDVVGRYGGEEIVVLLRDISAIQAFTTVEKLRKTIESTSISCRDNTINVTISIGVAHSPAGNAHSLENMLSQADSALYHAKSSGRNHTCLYK